MIVFKCVYDIAPAFLNTFLKGIQKIEISTEFYIERIVLKFQIPWEKKKSRRNSGWSIFQLVNKEESQELEYQLWPKSPNGNLVAKPNT